MKPDMATRNSDRPGRMTGLVVAALFSWGLIWAGYLLAW